MCDMCPDNGAHLLAREASAHKNKRRLMKQSDTLSHDKPVRDTSFKILEL